MVFIGKALQYGLFYIIIGLLILSFRRKTEESREVLSFDATKELKGIAILMVLMGHLTYMVGYMTMPITPVLGAPAVDVFLFLSAFGLLHSYEKRGLQHFVRRRLSIILIPYLFLTLLKIPFMHTTMQQSKSDILLNFSLLSVSGDPTMWYIQYILLWYLAFFLIFSILKCEIKTKSIILMVLGLLLFFWNGSLYYQHNMAIGLPLVESYSHHLSFPLGALCYLGYEKIKKMSKLQYGIIAAVVFVIVQFFAYPGVDGYVKYYLNNLGYVIFLIALWGLLSRFSLHSKLLSWLGGLSYYIYLNEYVVIMLMFQTKVLPNGIKAVVIIAVSVIIAIPLKWVCEKGIQKVEKSTIR